MCVREIAEHSHYVQGVAWDPMNEYIATQSSDRCVRFMVAAAADRGLALRKRISNYKVRGTALLKDEWTRFRFFHQADIQGPNSPAFGCEATLTLALVIANWE
jgi:hypothetical protein